MPFAAHRLQLAESLPELPVDFVKNAHTGDVGRGFGLSGLPLAAAAAAAAPRSDELRFFGAGDACPLLLLLLLALPLPLLLPSVVRFIARSERTMNRGGRRVACLPCSYS